MRKPYVSPKVEDHVHERYRVDYDEAWDICACGAKQALEDRGSRDMWTQPTLRIQRES
jgi:hypothetical protein